MDLIGRQIGNYVVKKQLGAGGMGTVYVCEHPLLGRQVALKVLHEEHARDPATVERFFHEAKAANAIRHPNIVDINDFGTLPAEDGRQATVYLVMELLEGKSLSAAIPQLTFDEALHVTRQCCRALAASHSHGIVHRDLKPENIFLITRDEDALFVKIVDFGIAKLMNPGEGGKTQIGTIIGTPAYMSPEQCEGRGHVDHRADIYSLGVVLYEMLAKRLPFQADNFAKLAIMHMTQPPPPPSQVDPRIPPELEAIVLHAMEKAPGDRFQTMDQMLAAINNPAAHLRVYQPGRAASAARSGKTMIIGASDVFAGQVAPVAPTPTPAPAPTPAAPLQATAVLEAPPEPHPLRRRRGIAAAAIAAVAIVAGGIVAVALNTSERPAAPIAVTPPAPEPVEPTPTEPTPKPIVTPPPIQPAAVPDAAPAMIAVRIETEPPGATVSRDGVVVGVTPLTLQAPRGAPAITVDITMVGFGTERRVVPTDMASQLVIMLKPVEKPRTRRRTAPELKPLEL